MAWGIIADLRTCFLECTYDSVRVNRPNRLSAFYRA